MRTTGKLTRVLHQTVGLVAVLALLQASLKCCLAGMPACSPDPPAQHGHDDQDPCQSESPGESHSHGDTGSCCCSFKAITSAPSPSVSLSKSADLSTTNLVATLVPATLPPLPPTGLMYDHGPPGLAPPPFLSVQSVSPRSPPARA